MANTNTNISQAASEFGRMGGSVKSEAKAKASAENGKQGGRKVGAKATYYVEVDSYWQNSPSWFVGPFASRAEAEREIERLTALDGFNRADRLARDVKDDYRVYVSPRSKTAAKLHGMHEETVIPPARATDYRTVKAFILS